MRQSTERVIGVLIVAGMIGVWAYNSWFIQPERKKHRITEQHSESSQRFKDWAYVAKEKQITPGETIKLVIIPSSFGHEILDTKCLIYTNAEFKTSSMICPYANKNDIQEGE